MELLLGTILFFTLYTFLSGTHDGYLLLHVNEYRFYSRGHSAAKIDLYNRNWHICAFLEKSLVYIVIFAGILHLSGLYTTIVLALLAVSVRMLLFDYFVYKTAGLGVDYYPTKNGPWDLWDGLILYLRDVGISQYFFKLAIFISIIVLYLLTCI